MLEEDTSSAEMQTQILYSSYDRTRLSLLLYERKKGMRIAAADTET
jgi:hypothetical protein